MATRPRSIDLINERDDQSTRCAQLPGVDVDTADAVPDDRHLRVESEAGGRFSSRFLSYRHPEHCATQFENGKGMLLLPLPPEHLPRSLAPVDLDSDACLPRYTF